MDNGTVEISGDYVVSTVTTSSDGSNVYAYVSTAYLYMDDDGDIMTVGGDFIWYGRSATLTKGTLTIKGNFEDMSTNSSRIIAASGDHVTVLDGDGSRTVTFASTSAHFNILQLMNAKSLYTFSFEPCWNEIIYEYEMAYTVSFDANYTGAEEIEDQIVPSGTTATAPVLSREGFSYIWCLDGTTTEYDFDTPVRSDLELYAKWTRVSHTVTFDANGGELTDGGTISVKHNATADEPYDPNFAGYAFDGWFTEDGTLFDFGTTLITEDITLYAHWTKCEVEEPIVITSQPTDTKFVFGEKVPFTITAEGNGLSYTWYYLKAGTTTWKSWPQNTSALSVTANSTWEGMQVYCEITDADGNVVKTNVITLTVAE